MQIDEFELRNFANNHADVFAAVGLASLISPLGDAIIRETPSGFVVKPAEPITEEFCRSLPRHPGYLYLRPNADPKTEPPAAIPAAWVFDYPKEKERNEAYKKIRQDAKKAGTDLKEAVSGFEPHKDFDLYQTLNTLQGDGATNKVAVAIAGLSDDEWGELLWNGLRALSSGDTAPVPWSVDLVQLFTPHAAKGFARLKPDSTSRGDKTKDSWSDPFLEWLRFRGFFAGIRRFFLGSKGEHLRLVTPVPRGLQLAYYRRVLEELREAPLVGSSASKTDCLAVLRLAEILIRRSETKKPPRAQVGGVTISHYQSMGQSKAISSIEQLAVPGWFPYETEEDKSAWLGAIDEHFSVLRSLNDQFSNELGLIQQYRKYLEARGDSAILELLDFMGGYGVLVLRERAKTSSRKLKQFSTEYFEAIMQNTRYADILANPGFLAVSQALRSATVSAQSLKRNGQNHREIRYDILPELHRKRQLPGKAPFLEGITEFVASYNIESARRFELKKESGIGRVKETDLVAFIELVDAQKDASVIGAMLCAHATCKKPRDPKDPGSEEGGDGAVDGAESDELNGQEENDNE
ncbi:MAG: hypothetical protein IT169_06305 [Bryobacterales bacterium]|nr:hypothetical protein [Bryobacterales bacterium]